VTMDEPFFFGHRDSSKTSCHESPEVLAHALVQGMAIVRKYFPNAQFGADEVVDADQNWVQELARWTDTYKAITGEPLAYIDADLDWSEGAVRNLVPLAAALKQRHVALGVIYDADRFNNNSDENWSRNTVAHFAKVESESGSQTHDFRSFHFELLRLLVSTRPASCPRKFRPCTCATSSRWL
jgi:hypothetical protein